MPANLENWAVAKGLGKISFHFNPKDRQCQRTLKHSKAGVAQSPVGRHCSLPSVLCAQGFVCALWASLMGLRFDFKCNWSSPTILLRLLLFTCGCGVPLFGGIQHSPVDGCCPQDWKRSVFIPVPKKERSNYCTIALISHASKVMLKILQDKASTVCEPRISRCSSWI